MNHDELDSMLEEVYTKKDSPPPGMPPPEGPPPPPPPAQDEDGRERPSSAARSDGDHRGGSRDRRHEGSSRDRDKDRDDGSRRRTRSPIPERRRSRSPGYRRRRSPSPRGYRDDRYRGGRRRSPSPGRRRRSPSPGRRRRSRSPRSRRRSPSPPPRKRSASPKLSDMERDMRTVMVMQLPRNCVPADLIEHFSKAGKVRDAKMIADRNSRKSKGIAYVEFVEPESVAAALAMNGERMGPAPLIIMMTQSEKNRQAALKEKEQLAGGPCRVAVANLPPDLTSAQLRVLFEPFAEAAGNTKIKEAKVTPPPARDGEEEDPDMEVQLPGATGILEFEVSAAAQMAVEKMNGVEVMGRPLRVSLQAAIVTGPHGGMVPAAHMMGMPGMMPMAGAIPGMPNPMMGMMGMMPQAGVPPVMGGVIPGMGMPLGMVPPPPGIMPPPAGMPPPPGMPPPASVVADAQGGMGALDREEVDRSGVAMTAQSRHELMTKLAARDAPGGGAPMAQAAAPAAAPVYAAAPVLETRQFYLNNMFDPETETDPGWDKDIRDEVLEECQKYGPVVHLAVDKFSKGNVYVRFATVDGARAARLVMHGRFFDGKMISAVYLDENQYNAKFPDALGKETPLPPP